LIDIAPFATSIIVFFGIYWILGTSFNLEFGFAGQPNFGKVLFYSVGAYVAGNLSARILSALAGTGGNPFCSSSAAKLRTDLAIGSPALDIGLFLASIVLAAAISGALGYATSFPALRLSGDFLAIVLIAVAEIGRILARTYDPIACSVYGLDGIGNPFIWLRDPLKIDLLYTALVLSFAVGVHFYAERLVNSPYGRVLKSIRDDELVSRVLGKETPKIKGQVLIIGSALAGLAGALYAFYAGAVFADDFVPVLTFTVVMMVIVGGVANNYGTILGALLVTLFDRFTRASFLNIIGVSMPYDITYLRYILIGVLLILVLMFRPQGLIPEGPIRTPGLELLRPRR